MIDRVFAIRGLLLAVLVLMAGNGFMPTLLAMRMEGAGAAAPVVGLMASAYFFGLVAGSLTLTNVIKQVGHIRTFATVVTVLSSSTLFYSLYQNAVLWSALRLLDGVCVAGVFICLESWLNHRADAQSRGTILAAYMIALYSGQAVGQFLLGLDTGLMLPFVVSSMLVSLSSVPVLLTKIDSPPLPDDGDHLSLPALFRTSPLGTVGVTLTGVMMGAFYGLGALYARRSGFDLSDVALFVSVVIAGGVALQWPLGHLSDRMDRRLVIVMVLAGILLASLVLALVTDHFVIFGMGALFGGFVFSLYPLCVAHANDRLTAAEQLSASSVLILLYSGGAAGGPLLGSAAMAAFGPRGLFLFMAALGTVGVGFALWRMYRSDAVAGEDQQPYQILPRTTPAAAALEPASQGSDEVA